MKVKSLLRFGALTVLSVGSLMPLMAFDSYKNLPISTPAKAEVSAIVTEVSTPAAPADMVYENNTPVVVTTDLGPSVLTASYKGHSGCSPTNYDFEIAIDVLDASNNIYRVKNLLDEGQVLKAKLKDGHLEMGHQKMGSYNVTGSIDYLENPARLETRVKYDDGIGFCDDVSVFVKR